MIAYLIMGTKAAINHGKAFQKFSAVLFLAPLHMLMDRSKRFSGPLGYRKLAIVESLGMFGLIMLYIWRIHAAHPHLWIAILGLMLPSHLSRRESPGALGFGIPNQRGMVGEVAPWLALLILLILACGMLFHTFRSVSFYEAVVAMAGYLPWGLLQQYVLNGYFFNRLDASLPGPAAAIVTATLFSCAHTPNWFLMAVTLLGGYCCISVYRQHRNLYLLGACHAIVGFLLFLVVPDSVSHHLRVGPAWYR